MATRVPVDGQLDPTTQKQTWSGLLNGDDGKAVSAYEYSDKSIHVFGNFGVGGQLDLEGSNDGGTNWAILRGYDNELLSITEAGIYLVVQISEKVRPNVVTGDGSTSLTAAMVGGR